MAVLNQLVSNLKLRRRKSLMSNSKLSTTAKPKLKLKSHEGVNYRGEEDKEDREKRDESVAKHQQNINRAIYATKVGAIANLGLASTKGVVGLMVSSTALIAGYLLIVFA